MAALKIFFVIRILHFFYNVSLTLASWICKSMFFVSSRKFSKNFSLFLHIIPPYFLSPPKQGLAYDDSFPGINLFFNLFFSYYPCSIQHQGNLPHRPMQVAGQGQNYLWFTLNVRIGPFQFQGLCSCQSPPVSLPNPQSTFDGINKSP